MFFIIKRNKYCSEEKVCTKNETSSVEIVRIRNNLKRDIPGIM